MIPTFAGKQVNPAKSGQTRAMIAAIGCPKTKRYIQLPIATGHFNQTTKMADQIDNL